MDAVRKTGLILPVFLKLHNLTSNTSWCSLKKMFENVRGVNPKIECIYLTIYENQRYKHRINKTNVYGEIFELFKPSTNMNSAIKKGVFYDSASGDWEKLVKNIKDLR